MRKNFIVGSAGHVDHGKTSLIKALTGTDTDRLPEEKARGLSIDLGFASLALPGDLVLGIVDVPGHERFLKNMLAGVGGYDLGLLVVDAQEGVMPQTREHVEILDLLHTPRGVVALTKVDMVDDEFLELVEEDLREFLAGTFLANAPIVPVSSKTGKGLDVLRKTLHEQLAKAPVRDRNGAIRMPVDRVFSKTGFGTVVTGSVWSGTLRKGDRISLMPKGLETKVRGLQVHGMDVETATAGQRVAVNLAGVEMEQAHRGDVLSTPDSLQPTTRLDVRLQVLAKNARPLKHRAQVRLYCGTRETFGQVYLLEGDAVEPGQSVLVQLILQDEVTVKHRDRFVLRDFTASYTIGGGEVLNPLAERHRRHDESTLDELRQRETGGEDDTVIAGLRASSGWKTLSALASQLQQPTAAVETVLKRLAQDNLVVDLGKSWVLSSTLQTFQERLESILVGLQTNAPWKTGWRKEELLKLVAWETPKFGEEVLPYLLERGTLSQLGKAISLRGHQARLSAAQHAHCERVLSLLRSATFQPPTWEQIPELLKIDAAQWKILDIYLLESQRAVRVGPGMVFLQETLDLIPGKLATLGNFSPGQARDALDTSRKFLIPLLEYLDQVGWTQRNGDNRVMKR